MRTPHLHCKSFFIQPWQPIRTSRSNHCFVLDHFAARRSPLCRDPSFFEYTSTSRNRFHAVNVRGKFHQIFRLIFSRPFPALCSSTVVAILTSRKNGSKESVRHQGVHYWLSSTNFSHERQQRHFQDRDNQRCLQVLHRMSQSRRLSNFTRSSCVSATKMMSSRKKNKTAAAMPRHLRNSAF